MMKSPGYVKCAGFFLAAAMLLVCQPAFAEKRVALVLGNSAYQNVAKLPNPVNDGAVIARRSRTPASTWSIRATICRRPRPAARCATLPTVPAMPTIAWSIMPANGIEVDGANYLIPVERETGTRYRRFTTRRFRWIGCCWRSSPPRSCGW